MKDKELIELMLKRMQKSKESRRDKLKEVYSATVKMSQKQEIKETDE